MRHFIFQGSKVVNCCYTPHFANDDLVRARNWIDCTFDRNLKKNNLVFRTKDEAVATAKKMLRAISPQEEEK